MKLILDGNAIKDKESLHRHMEKTLDFPEWYGGNLDALYDCLACVQEDTQLVLIGWPDEGYAAKVRRVILDAVWENEHLMMKAIIYLEFKKKAHFYVSVLWYKKNKTHFYVS